MCLKSYIFPFSGYYYCFSFIH